MMTVIIIMAVIISSHDQYFLTGCNAKGAMMIVIMITAGNAEDARMIISIVMMLQ